MSIKAIFYSKFDPQGGPKVIHQVPENSIIPVADRSDGSAMFSFPSISPFVIPHQSLCGSFISLVPPPLQSASRGSTQSMQAYRILGHPICRSSPHYQRNEFMFNFCLVLSATEPDFNAYKSVVTKLAHLMLSLEEQSHFLSCDTAPPNSGKIYSLCETLMSDLNNYCECMIPMDDLNTLNLKLFPTYAPPPPVLSWQAPIFTVRPESLMDENWDLTMQRIVPYINGIRSVKQIALLADADLRLTKECMKHLLYYGCLLLLDIFSFNAIYAPTAEFSTTIAADEAMQRECARYVNTAFTPNVTAEQGDHAIVSPGAYGTDDEIWPLDSAGRPINGVAIVELFATLRQGRSVREWYAAKSDMLANIDLRRFITFGVIKGFVYRVHKYAYAVNRNAQTRKKRIQAATGWVQGQKRLISHPSQSNRVSSTARTHDDTAEDDDDDTETITSRTRPKAIYHPHRHRRRRRHTRHHSSTDNGDSSPPSSPLEDDDEDDNELEEEQEEDEDREMGDEGNEARLDPRLSRYLDGTHCFDQICTELEISEAKLEEQLRRWNWTTKTLPSPYQRSSGFMGPGQAVANGEVLIIHR